ncbi:hypothetical protein P3S67_031018 [Capsicum chacoense]
MEENNPAFPDGYVSNFGRLPDTNAKRLFGMKSHDCHVFMQRLMPIAFRELLPSNVWQALTELSLFFKDLTSTTLRVDDMMRSERDIPQILCKLERIFTPGFFDTVEHLPVHLPYEARVAGPMQYRWMYPFERYLGTLKKMIGNKASVEGSIYLKGNLSIFSHPGRLWGETKKNNLILEEIKAAQTYILLNCEEVEPFVSMYLQCLEEEFPNLSQSEIDESLEENFAIWFKGYARCNPIKNEYLHSLARGPLIGATSHSIYFVNGYKFYRKCHVEEVKVHKIDMSVFVDEDILLHDPNRGVLEMNESLNDGLFEEHHEIRDGCTEEEHEIEETEEEDEEKKFEEDMDMLLILNLMLYRCEPSSKYSSSITLSFKSEVDHNGINWKGVSQDIKDSYFGEFKKNFYWDASVSEVLVKQQWMKKAALCYKNFISNIKKHRATVQPKFVNDHVWKKWMELWQSDDCVKKSEINSKNRCSGHEVAAGTHWWLYHNWRAPKKTLALKIGRHPTPSELHLHVHTPNHDEKSFERCEEIIWEKVQCESEIDQLKTYYEAAGGAKKKRLFGLGSEATSYFGKKLCACNASISSVPPLISLPTTNIEELVKQLIPALTTHFLPIVIVRVGGTRVQDGPVLDPPPTHDGDDDIYS